MVWGNEQTLGGVLCLAHVLYNTVGSVPLLLAPNDHAHSRFAKLMVW